MEFGGAFKKDYLVLSMLHFTRHLVLSTNHYTIPNMCNQNYIESQMILVFILLNFLAFLYKNESLFDVLERILDAMTSQQLT